MKSLALVLLVCAVAVAAFLLGQRNAPSPAAPGQPIAAHTQAAPAPDQGEPTAPAPSGAGAEARVASSEPTRTFRGPDGRPQLISYDLDKVADSSDPAAVKAGLLSDMAHHPRNIARAYEFTEAEIAGILAGTRPFPDALLPPARPGSPARR